MALSSIKIEASRREGEATVESFARLGIAPQSQERLAERVEVSTDRGIESLAACLRCSTARIPAPEAELG